MKRFLTLLCLMALSAALSVSNVSAYVLPKGMGISNKEGEDYTSVLATEVYGYLGDADFNGKVNIRDATDIQKSVANITTLTDEGARLADVDFSGDINVRDATAVQKWLANVATAAPVYHLLYATDDEAGLEGLIGQWVGLVNIGDVLNAEFAADPVMAESFDFESVEITLLLTFAVDKTYKIAVDETAFDSTIEQFKADYAKGMTAYLEAFIKENNLATTVEDMVELSGFESMESMVDSIVTDETVIEALPRYSEEGNYAVDGNSIYVSSSLDDSELKGVAYYDFYDVTLILKGGDGLVPKNLQPAEFEKTE